MPPVKEKKERTYLTDAKLKEILSPKQYSDLEKIRNGSKKIHCVGTRKKEKINEVKVYAVNSSGKRKNTIAIMLTGKCSGTKNPNKGNKPYLTNSILTNIDKNGRKRSSSNKSSSSKKRSGSKKRSSSKRKSSSKNRSGSKKK